jgi:hypothetical protein
MNILIFGRSGCGNCEMAKSRANKVKEDLKDQLDIPVVFYDLGTVDGLAEASFWDALDPLPAIIITNKAGQQVASFAKSVPTTEELKSLIMEGVKA